jgi:hypothetical protein
MTSDTLDLVVVDGPPGYLDLGRGTTNSSIFVPWAIYGPPAIGSQPEVVMGVSKNASPFKPMGWLTVFSVFFHTIFIWKKSNLNLELVGLS